MRNEPDATFTHQERVYTSYTQPARRRTVLVRGKLLSMDFPRFTLLTVTNLSPRRPMVHITDRPVHSEREEFHSMYFDVCMGTALTHVFHHGVSLPEAFWMSDFGSWVDSPFPDNQRGTIARILSVRTSGLMTLDQWPPLGP